MRKGFTLIELLIVIAIIGILSSIVVSSLNAARANARLSAVQSQMSVLISNLILCRDAMPPGEILPPTSNTLGGGDVCLPATASSATWPPLPGSWQYSVLNGTADTFTVTASGDGMSVICSITGCRTEK